MATFGHFPGVAWHGRFIPLIQTTSLIIFVILEGARNISDISLGQARGRFTLAPRRFFFFLFFFTIFVCFYIEDGDVEMRMAAGSEHQNGHEAWYALLWYISRLDERRDTGVIIEHLIKIQSASSYRA